MNIFYYKNQEFSILQPKERSLFEEGDRAVPASVMARERLASLELVQVL